MMDRGSLYPPSIQSLRDGVIGSIVERPRTHVRSSVAGSDIRSVSFERADDGVQVSAELRLPDRKRSRDERSLLKRGRTAHTGVDKRDAASWLVYQRERHRINQTRYRERQNEFLASLVEENRKLREEFAGLEQSRISITPLQATPREDNVWSVAVEYFRLFRHGVPDTPSPTKACVQLDFMRATMAPDVEVNGGRGAETMLKSWRGRARWFDDVGVELLALLKGPGDSVVASTKASITITEQTLRYVFPHLRSDEDGGDTGAKKASIADRILGQRIVLYGSTIFGWGGDCNCVTSALAQSDMLTPMLALLGNLDDVALLFDKSLMLPDSKWKSTPRN